MLFNSYTFLFFLLAVFSLYYLPQFKKHQVLYLVGVSLIFYAWEYPIYLLLLLISAGINIFVSYRLVHTVKQNVQKKWVTGGVVLNLGILCFFKYGRLVSDTLLDPGTDVGSFLLQLPLPIGISFFTFEGISLLVDVYKGRKVEAFQSIVTRSLWQHSNNVLLFITFFPHLIAGPILKAHDFIPQIKTKRISKIDWRFCFRHLVLGYFLKMVIADNLKDQTFWIQYPYFEGHSSFTLLMLLLGYSAQIFADFAGYSLIALGLAGLFGYRLEENFNFPYIAASFSEFWRRWHISLSSFLREYLYIPLGGNRKGPLRTYANLMITMFLGGLWHGAAWSYAIWGVFHGLALATERFLKNYIALPHNIVIRFMKRFMIFGFVSLAWLLFKLPDFSHVVKYVQAIFMNTNRDNDFALTTYILFYTVPIFLYHGLYLIKSTPFYEWIFRKPEFIWYGVLLFFILTNSGSQGSFIYFQF